MQTMIDDSIQRANKSRIIRQKLLFVLISLSLVVALGVFWWLKLVGITMTDQAFCGLEEHTHTEECIVQTLVCSSEESDEHSHSDDCYEVTYSCGKEEHVHTSSCYSDDTADVETAEIWEATLADVELTGQISEDLAAVAQSQVGYAESTLNFQVGEDGVRRGYTRYGEWYGNPYGDWSAMFVDFCLSYADISKEDVPYNSGAESMRQQWAQAGLYQEADSHTPIKSDIVFLDKDENGTADAVGIVSSAETETIAVIEGDSDDAVCTVSYSLTDSRIMGYGSIVEVIRSTASESQLKLVDEVIAEIDSLPSADEVESKLEVYEEAGDMDGYQSYFEDVGYAVIDAYNEYIGLGADLRLLVTNTEKLDELDWIRSWPTLLIDEITSDTPTKVDSASTSEFIELNLYDYGSNINEMYKSNNKYPGFQWNGGAYLKSTYDRHVVDYIDFGNSMISNFSYGSSSSGSYGKSSNAQMIGMSDGSNGAINKLDVSSYGVTNRPIGMSLNSSITDTSNDVLLRTLGSDGYPALTDGTSLSYLFSNGTYATKKNTESIDGLFQQDSTSGEYYYNSRINHAQYSNNKFTLYNQIITPNFIVYPFGNFLPFNKINDGSKATQVSKITGMGDYVQEVINDLVNASDYSSNETKKQLVDMLAMYRSDMRNITTSSGTAWTTWSAADAINDYFTTNDSDSDNPSSNTSLITNALLKKMYNIDWDVNTNFFFGMDMHMEFIQPKNGMTGYDTNKDGTPDYEMVYYFTGDDDVWVYIDGVLFMDLSGIHRHVGGEIDFVEGKVYYYYLDTAGTGDVSSTPYQTYTFKEILKAAGKSTDGLNANGTFKDYTTHTFDFYYMERGSGSSVCRMNFNFPLLQQNRIEVSKTLSSVDADAIGDPDFKFQVYKENGTELLIGADTEYTLYDESRNEIGTGKTDENGVFTIKAGQTAVFANIPENSGKYFVRELLDESVFEQYGTVTVNGTSTTTNSVDVVIDNDTFKGYDSPVKDMSDGSTSFEFNNSVDSTKYGSLEITKTLNDYTADQEQKEFTFDLKIDGVDIPAGTKYTLIHADGTTEEKTIAAAGKLTFKSDETVRFEKVLAGTLVTLEEDSDSSEGYVVTYSVPDSWENADGGVKGIVVAGSATEVAVNNDREGTRLPVSGTKSLIYPDGSEHSYTFILREVNSKSDLNEKTGGTYLKSKVNIADADVPFSFTINYPSGTEAGLHYYKIYEDGVTAGDGKDSTFYIVEVQITLADDQTVETAVITNIWKNGTEESAADTGIQFTNQVVQDLTISKVVERVNTGEQKFDFTVTAAINSAPLNGAFAAEFTGADSTVTAQQVTFTDGQLSVSLADGESIKILGLPYGTVWTVEEEEPTGFFVEYEVAPDTSASDSESTGSNTTAGGTLTTDQSVQFTNIGGYELPATGSRETLYYISGGTLLMLFALVCGCILRRKRERRSP